MHNVRAAIQGGACMLEQAIVAVEWTMVHRSGTQVLVKFILVLAGGHVEATNGVHDLGSFIVWAYHVYATAAQIQA